jgi:hypothetical protein
MAGRDFALIKRAMRHELDPRNFSAAGDGITNDTAAVQAAIDEAISLGATVDLGGRSYLVDTLVFDGSFFGIRNGTLIASTNIPASGAILLSLAGGADETVNQALLDGIYGTDVYLVRTNVAGSLEGVHFDDVTFVGGANDIRGIWATGFTRGCRIMGCYFDGVDADGICLNGSWSFSLINNFYDGAGVGISLGRTGNGERSGAIVVNAACIVDNELTGGTSGMIWNFGAGGSVVGNRFEFLSADGFASQSVTGLTVMGNYFEDCDGDNLDMGGTNGTDFADGWVVIGNYLNNDSGAGNNIRLDGVKNCTIGPNYFGGTRTQHYFIPSAGGGLNVLDNDIYVPDLTSTYITNPEELDASTNNIRFPGGKKVDNQQNADYTFTIHDPARITRKNSGGAGETWTIPANSSVPFRVGTVLEGVNYGGGTLSIAITTDTLHHSAGTGTRTIASGSYFRIIKVTSTVWAIEGTGIT